jgi:RNA polymerase sigma factor (sigma-70 family)
LPRVAGLALENLAFKVSSPSEEKKVITQTEFAAMLAWLDPHSEQRAAEKYEEIRRRLVQIHERRGCREAEELFDETSNRVCKKVKEVAPTYTGDPALYFYAVANKVCLEYLKKNKKRVPTPPSPPDTEEVERRHACLDHCLGKQSPVSRELILQYYEGEKQAKIQHRQRVADLLGIDLKTLRVRARRIRVKLLECMSDCLKKEAAG